MASPVAFLPPNVVRDSNPTNSLRYRSLLKDIDNGIGERDMDKLRYLCQDLGVAPRKFETMKRGIELFMELEKLSLIMPDDISLLTSLMQTINRFDLVKKLKGWSTKEGALSRRLSDYRKLMLKISDSLTKDEREQLRFLLGGHGSLPVSVMEECKTLLQLFAQMEKFTMIGPTDLGLLVNLVSEVGNQAIVKEIQMYLHQAPMSSSSSDPNMYAASYFGSHSQPAAPVYNPQQGGYNSAATTGTWRSNSDPSFSNLGSQVSGGSSWNPVNPPQWQPLVATQQGLQQPQQLSQQPQHVESEHYLLQQKEELRLRMLQGHKQQATASGNFGQSSAASLQRPKWYDEAVAKSGKEYADRIYEQYMSMSRDEIEKRMQRLQISPTETTPSMKTEGQGSHAEDQEDARVGQTHSSQIEQPATISESRQGSSTSSEPQSRIVPAQTATIGPYRGISNEKPTLPRYPMRKLPRGLCIIFNAKNFTASSQLETRDGTNKDVEALSHTFMDKLKFRLYVKEDPKAQDYINCLTEIQRMDHSEYDAFVCIILSHGLKGCVLGIDGKKVVIEDMTNLFRGSYVPSLAGKPKLFFIQACQGTEAHEGIPIRQDATATVPNESDTLVSLSTVPGYVSNRSPKHGTWFISSLCTILNQHYQQVDLLSMLTMVNDMLSSAADKEQMKQIGNPSHTLRKQVFFGEE